MFHKKIGQLLLTPDAVLLWDQISDRKRQKHPRVIDQSLFIPIIIVHTSKGE